MNYKLYQKSRDAAWQILLDCGVNALPVRVTSICQKLGIAVRLYEPSPGTDGYCCKMNGQYCMFINKNVSVQRQRFTAAHELGHIILGHIGKYELVNREPSPKDNEVEQAANVFASRLLAPACVLWGLGVNNAEQIAKVCDISMQSAEFRAARLSALIERDRFRTSPIEDRVYRQFEEYIQNNKLI